jgi:hypothetical protein
VASWGRSADRSPIFPRNGLAGWDRWDSVLTDSWLLALVWPHDARTVQLSLAFHDSNITGTSGPKGMEGPRESLSDSDDIKHYPAEQTQLPLPCRGPKADSLRGEVEIAICHLLSFQLTPIPLTEIRRGFVGALQEGQ